MYPIALFLPEYDRFINLSSPLPLPLSLSQKEKQLVLMAVHGLLGGYTWWQTKYLLEIKVLIKIYPSFSVPLLSPGLIQIKFIILCNATEYGVNVYDLNPVVFTKSQ